MILAIESSCDESALALLAPGRGIVGEWISSQVALHSEYGGVVPDLASREHLNNFGPLLGELKSAWDLRDVREIVVTAGPGLAGCLAMGIAVAKSLSVALGVPVYAANHLRAHAQSVFISEYESEPEEFDQRLKSLLPHLGLVVSGGNTLLVKIDEERRISLLGQTIDDAAGEALDKGAKLMDIGYPGGPKLEKIAFEGDPTAHRFPRALMNKPNLDFSFSGLKTSLRYTIDDCVSDVIDSVKPDLCASYQEAVIDALIRKTERALKRAEFKSLGLSGGVSNNLVLRDRLAKLSERRNIPGLLAKRCHTGDNAGMIAFNRVFENAARPPSKVDIMPSISIETLV